jgi:hypothetical protein
VSRRYLSVSRAIGGVRLSLPTPVSASDRQAVLEHADARLTRTIRDFAGFEGHGQEMGRDAEGPEVNRRRNAVSILWARYGDRVREKLPRRKTMASDLTWLGAAERQPVALGRPFDFSWSTNPMSTEEVLTELANQRALRAVDAAHAMEKMPGAAHDASDDGLTCHLHLTDGDLRSHVLADTLLQLRASRRGGEDPGRIGTIAVVNAFEQRLACAALPEGDDLAARRERGLLRFVVAQQCGGSVNALYDARNTVAILPDYLGTEVFDTLYPAIHHLYSGKTPKVVEDYLTERAFTAGPKEHRLDVLKAVVEAGSAEKLKDAKAILKSLEERFDHSIPGALSARTKDDFDAALVPYFRKNTKLPAIERELEDRDLVKTHALLLSLHRSLASTRPTADELELDAAWGGKIAEFEVAALVHTLRHGELAAQIEAVGAARAALAKAFAKTESGFERQMLIRLDRKVELVSTELLGTALEKIGSDDASLPLCLLAVRSAIRGVLAGDLPSLRARPKTGPADHLDALLAEIDRKFARGSVDPDEARVLLGRVFQSATEVADAMRIFLRRREAAIHFSKVDVELDPYAIDGLIKETPLHYLLGLAEKGLGGTNWTEGARALNSVGPRVYQRVLTGDTVEDLKRWKPTADDLCVIENAREKRLAVGGGLILDSKDAGPGYSHAAVFAKGHGISAIALPDLARRYVPMFKEIEGEVYVDDRPSSFAILPLEEAIAKGLVKREDVDSLRPGTNRSFSWFDVDADGKRSLVKKDETHPFEDREVKEIELIVPDLTDKLHLGGPISFEELAKLPIDQARQLAGEKGTVLARLGASARLKELGVKVPDGAVIPPFVVAGLLRDAGILEKWQKNSKRTDPSRFGDEVKRALIDLLLDGGRPTAAGKELLRSLESHPALKGRVPWIARSSFTGEDRPNKSAAGQYDSFPNLLSAKQRLEGIVGVIASAWNADAVRTQKEMGVDTALIWPAIVLQPCLAADKSGVAFSRGPNGAFGVVGFQAKKGFGGGVGGGPAEEGILRKDHPLAKSLLTERQQKLLYDAVLEIEHEFDRSIEPSGHHAIDAEWVFVGSVLNIVQARTLAS